MIFLSLRILLLALGTYLDLAGLENFKAIQMYMIFICWGAICWLGDLFAVSEIGEHANGYTELVEARNAVMVDISLIKADIQDIVRALLW